MVGSVLEQFDFKKQNNIYPTYLRLVTDLYGPYLPSDQGYITRMDSRADKVELIVGKEPRIEVSEKGESDFILPKKNLRLPLQVSGGLKSKIIDDPYQYHELYAPAMKIFIHQAAVPSHGAQFV